MTVLCFDFVVIYRTTRQTFHQRGLCTVQRFDAGQTIRTLYSCVAIYASSRVLQSAALVTSPGVSMSAIWAWDRTILRLSYLD